MSNRGGVTIIFSACFGLAFGLPQPQGNIDGIVPESFAQVINSDDQCLSLKPAWTGYTCAKAAEYCSSKNEQWKADMDDCCASFCLAKAADQCLSSTSGWKGYTCARAVKEKYCNHAKWRGDVLACCSKACNPDASTPASTAPVLAPAPVPAPKAPEPSPTPAAQTPDQCLSSKSVWKGYTCARAVKEKYCNHATWKGDVLECCSEACNPKKGVAETITESCKDINVDECQSHITLNRQLCQISQKFKLDCAQTCGECNKPPPPSCVAKATLGSCQNCRYSEQCADGRYCCPFMKKCIVSGQQCYDPVAECSPRCPAKSSPVSDCKGCKIVNQMGGWDKWAPPTCGSSMAPAPAPAPAPESERTCQDGNKNCANPKWSNHCGNPKAKFRGVSLDDLCPRTCGTCP